MASCCELLYSCAIDGNAPIDVSVWFVGVAVALTQGSEPLAALIQYRADTRHDRFGVRQNPCFVAKNDGFSRQKERFPAFKAVMPTREGCFNSQNERFLALRDVLLSRHERFRPRLWGGWWPGGAAMWRGRSGFGALTRSVGGRRDGRGKAVKNSY